MSKLPWFSFYPADFLTDSAVMRMNNQQKGIYIMLLSTAWLEGGIPADLAQVAAMVHESEQSLSSAWPLLAEKWLPDPSDPRRLINPRMEFERMKQQQIAAAKANAGALGGKSRAQKAVSLRSNAQAVLDSASSRPQANSSQSQSQSQSQTTTTKDLGTTRVSKGIPTYPEWLDLKLWGDFLEHRKKLKKPMTPRAEELSIKALEDVFSTVPERINRIREALTRGWLGLVFAEDRARAAKRPSSPEGEHGPFSNRP